MYCRLPNRLASRAFSSAPSDVLPPLRRHRTATSVLEALSRATGPSFFDPNIPRDGFLVSARRYEFESSKTYLQKGREAAQFFLKKDPNLFSKFRFAQPEISAFQPTYSAENVGEDSEAALEQLIVVLEASEAHEMFKRLTEDGAKPEAVSQDVRLRLLELLAAGVGTLSLRAWAYDFGSSENIRRLRDSVWNLNGPAEQLFASFEGEEKGKAAYQAMIRGAADLKSTARALQLYAEMRERDLWPDLPTFNALLGAVGFAEEGPWAALLRIFGDLLAAGLEPNAESFNAMLRALQGETIPRLEAVLEEMRLRRVKPNAGTAAALVYLASSTKFHAITKQTLDVLDHLLASPVRLEFSHNEDVQMMFLIAEVPFTLNVQILKRLVCLYAHSPRLWINDDVIATFLYRSMQMLVKKEPHFALSLYKEHLANRTLLTTNFKLRILRYFLKHEPDSVDLVLNDVCDKHMQSTSVSLDSADALRPIVTVMLQAMEVQSLCRDAVFRSAKYFCGAYPTHVPLPDEFGCYLIAICIPEMDVPNLEERVTFAWQVFQRMNHSPGTTYCQVHRMLMLCAGLAKFGRFQNAALLLERFMTAGQLEETDIRVDKVRPLLKEILSMDQLVNFLKDQDPDLFARVHRWSIKGELRMIQSGLRNDVDVWKGVKLHLTERPHGEDFGRISREDALESFAPSVNDSAKKGEGLTTRRKKTKKRSRQKTKRDLSSSSSSSDSDSDRK